MSWQTLEERELGLNPKDFTKKKWNPQQFIGAQRNAPQKSTEEQFIDERGWTLVDENDEQRSYEQFQREIESNPELAIYTRQPNPLGDLGASAMTEQEAKALMLKRLSGL